MPFPWKPNGLRFDLADRQFLLVQGGNWDGWLAVPGREPGTWKPYMHPGDYLRAAIHVRLRMERGGRGDAELLRQIEEQAGGHGRGDLPI